jgi:hypothetical protein
MSDQALIHPPIQPYEIVVEEESFKGADDSSDIGMAALLVSRDEYDE